MMTLNKIFPKITVFFFEVKATCFTIKPAMQSKEPFLCF